MQLAKRMLEYPTMLQWFGLSFPQALKIKDNINQRTCKSNFDILYCTKRKIWSNEPNDEKHEAEIRVGLTGNLLFLAQTELWQVQSYFCARFANATGSSITLQLNFFVAQTSNLKPIKIFAQTNRFDRTVFSVQSLTKQTFPAVFSPTV